MSQRETQIRRANQADVPEMMDILNREIDESVSCFRTRPLSNSEAAEWWQAHPPETYPAWVATANDGSEGESIAGWASLSQWSCYEGYRHTAEVSIWIAASARRQGIGSRLMETLLNGALGRFRVLLSRIEATNQASIHLHDRYGFASVGTMHNVGEKFGQLLDVLIMEKQLELPTDHAS